MAARSSSPSGAPSRTSMPPSWCIPPAWSSRVSGPSRSSSSARRRFAARSCQARRSSAAAASRSAARRRWSSMRPRRCETSDPAGAAASAGETLAEPLAAGRQVHRQSRHRFRPVPVGDPLLPAFHGRGLAGVAAAAVVEAAGDAPADAESHHLANAGLAAVDEDPVELALRLRGYRGDDQRRCCGGHPTVHAVSPCRAVLVWCARCRARSRRISK